MDPDSQSQDKPSAFSCCLDYNYVKTPFLQECGRSGAEEE